MTSPLTGEDQGFQARLVFARIKYPGPDFGERCPVVRFQATQFRKPPVR